MIIVSATSRSNNALEKEILPLVVILKSYVGLDSHFLFIYSWFWSFVLLVFLGEIIWDMRDIKGDEANDVKTIPVVIGLKNTRWVILALLFFVYLPLSIYTNQFSAIVLLFFIAYTLFSGPDLPKLIFHFPIFIIYGFNC